ncbi:hypothetical protein CYMTET_8955 [Cymbomonas tetramitiformis]|uniref:RING-type domain-containing protein n=1 Tax=Cymbomonas tetramitiformis TaxID=36881 RepID=A0AAE0GS00_9CHLO|nr:hypothetical protein CYMTET_8955 [Cymbomonas tetramitiformis]
MAEDGCCLVCCDNIASPVKFLPCGHHACSICVKTLRAHNIKKADAGVRCPFCRQVITAYTGEGSSQVGAQPMVPRAVGSTRVPQRQTATPQPSLHSASGQGGASERLNKKLEQLGIQERSFRIYFPTPPYDGKTYDVRWVHDFGGYYDFAGHIIGPGGRVAKQIVKESGCYSVTVCTSEGSLTRKATREEIYSGKMHVLIKGVGDVGAM